MTDISVNITCHKEGYLLYQTLRSIANSINYLKIKNHKLNICVNLSLDNPDDTTEKIAQEFKYFNCKYTIYNLAYGQPALCRNYLIDKSESRYIVFFDGDDFFSENYLYEAYKMAERIKTPCVLSVAAIIEFDQASAIFIRPCIDVNSPDFIAYIMNDNPVNSCVFARASIFKENKYESVAPGSGFGYEDWHWNTKLFAKKIPFYVIPNTVLFYRRCHDPNRSVLAAHTGAKTVLRPSELFKPSAFIKNNNSFIKYQAYDTGASSSNSIDNDSKKLRFLKRLPLPFLVKVYLHEQYAVLRHLIVNVKLAIRKRVNKDFTAEVKQGDIVDIKLALKERLRTENINDISAEIVAEQWNKVNKFEPLIWPTVNSIQNMPIFEYRPSYNRLRAYYDLCKIVNKWGSNYNLVFVPWLILGGADLVTIETVNNLAKNNENILLVFTEKANSEWTDRLNKKIVTYNLASKESLNDEDKNDIFIKLILNTNPQRFISINSLFANNLLKDYSQLLSKYTDLYTYRFSLPRDGGGAYYEWPGNFYNSIIENVVVISDNKMAPMMYNDVFGRGIKNTRLIEMPVLKHPHMNNPIKLKKRILWASRIATDKLVLESIDIASQLPDDIHTDFYGTLDDHFMKNNTFKMIIDKYDNVNYRGVFNGFDTINASEYDLLLFVSRSEGTPIIILEAIGANLFVVASSVGGIPEVVKDGVNGKLISNPLDIESYVKSICEYYSRHGKSSTRVQTKFNEELTHRRTIKNLESSLDSIYYEQK